VSKSGAQGSSQSEGVKQEVEIQTATRKVKTKVEDDGKLKVEIEGPDVKLKYEMEDGELRLKTEDSKGEEKEASEREKTEVEDLLEQEDIEIASKEGELEFAHGGVHTRTNFPLSINPETNELVVTTSAGQKIVTILPDVAVQNMLAQGILTTIAADSNQSSSVRLETFDGEPTYRIEGEKKMRLFGLIPISVQTTAFVSPQDGAVLAQQRSLLSNILSFVSAN
jgi:hypothetical protein